MYLGELGLIISTNQGGQGAIALTPLTQTNTPASGPSGFGPVAPASAPITPTSLVPALPTMSTKPGPQSGGCLTAAAVGSGANAEPQTPLSCRVSSWADDHLLLAVLAVAGTYMLFKRM